VLKAADSRGVRVPEQLSVAGFDDLPMAAYAMPSLTTVRQPIGEMARLAVARVLDGVAERAGAALVLERVQLGALLFVAAGPLGWDDLADKLGIGPTRLARVRPGLAAAGAARARPDLRRGRAVPGHQRRVDHDRRAVPRGPPA
jgi:Periplasmic binding protein-like domain